MKEKTDNLDLIKIKFICSIKDMVKRIKRLTTNGGKYLQNTCLVKNSVFRIYKECLRDNDKKINHSNLK